MTKKEVNEFAVRLTRVWDLDRKSVKVESDDYGGFIVNGVLKNSLRLHADIVDDELSFELFAKGGGCALMASQDFQPCPVTGLSQRQQPNWVERQEQFADQWLPLFRRGCWLSGLPVEASATEKTEWIQGFTRQEIEAWSLEF